MKYTQNLRIDGAKVYSYNTHVATIDRAAGTLIVHGHWSMTTSKHVNHVAAELGLRKVDGEAPKQEEREQDNGASLLRSVVAVASLAAVFTGSQKESNDWKLRMMKAGLETRGLSIPENWDQLSEEEKTKRLDAALKAIS